jgi:hypothetical protein
LVMRGTAPAGDPDTMLNRADPDGPGADTRRRGGTAALFHDRGNGDLPAGHGGRGDQDEADGTVVVLVEHPEGSQLDLARMAVHICPSRALSLVET